MHYNIYSYIKNASVFVHFITLKQLCTAKSTKQMGDLRIQPIVNNRSHQMSCCCSNLTDQIILGLKCLPIYLSTF